MKTAMKVAVKIATAAALAVLSFEPLQSADTTGPGAGKAALGQWGVDLTGMDRSVRPGDDFFGYVSGAWVRTTEIPADRSSWGSFERLREKSERDVMALVNEVAASRQPLPGPARKMVDFYAAFVNQAAIDAAGLKPAKPVLDEIAAARTHEDIARLLVRPDLGLESPFEPTVSLDQKNPDRYVIAIRQGGLGLPDREYYLKDDARFSDILVRYAVHVERLLALAQQPAPLESAKTLVSLETKIARLHWPRAKRRERELTYNPHTFAELQSLAAHFPWKAAFQPAGLGGEQTYILRELDSFAPIAALFRARPVAEWRIWLTYHYLKAMAPVAACALRCGSVRLLRPHARRPAAATRARQARSGRDQCFARRGGG